MANYITTLKDDNGTNILLPKTVLKAVADDNGNYLDSGLAASDINKLKGGEIVKLEENLARIETSPTTHAYSVGERLVYNGILYRVKAAISVGADLVVNTNIEKKSVDDALSDIMTTGTITWNYNFVNSVYSSTCIKIGNTCIVGFCINPKANSSVTLCTLPIGFRPSSETTCIMANVFNENSSDKQYLMNGYVYLKTNGEIYQNYGAAMFVSNTAYFSVLFMYNV